MAHTSTRIYIDTNTTPNKGVEIADVKAVLALPNNDIGGLITDGAEQGVINKWAKCKPIAYYLYDPSTQTKTPYPGLLTDEMRKGPVIEQQDDGVYYGIVVRVPTVDQQMNTWPLLHGTTFTYRPPRGLAYSEMFRLRDFEEYRTNAKSNPFASFGDEGNATGYYDYDNGISGIEVRYYDPQNGNPYGVDLTSVLIDPSYSTTSALSKTYPCIIVGKGNTHYITALGYEDALQHAPRPMYYNNAYVGGTWVANTHKPVYGSQSTNGPWTSPQSGLLATVVLLRSAYPGDANRITLDVAGQQDLATHWFECTSTLLTDKTPVPVPGAVGVNLSLVVFATGITVSATSISYNPTTDVVTVNFDFAGSPVGTGSFTAEVYTTIGANSGPMKTTSGSVDFHRVFSVMYQGLEANFGIVYNPIQPTTRSVSIRVKTFDGSVTNESIQNDFTLSL